MLAMAADLIKLRRPKRADAADLAAVYEESWREAYQGLLPHLTLERMIARRGSGWWRANLSRGGSYLALEFDGDVVGYASYGHCRSPALGYDGEIYELYLKPVCQGNGFGRRLFRETRDALRSRGMPRHLVWALACNERGRIFYKVLGGRAVAQTTEKLGGKPVDKIAYGWDQ